MKMELSVEAAKEEAGVAKRYMEQVIADKKEGPEVEAAVKSYMAAVSVQLRAEMLIISSKSKVRMAEIAKEASVEYQQINADYQKQRAENEKKFKRSRRNVILSAAGIAIVLVLAAFGLSSR